MENPWENYGKSMGKLWKIHGKTMENPWENYGKSMGKLWKIHGKTMENPWENYGKSMGKLWKIHGKTMENPWENYGKSMGKLWKIHGKTMENPWENYGKSMGNLWKIPGNGMTLRWYPPVWSERWFINHRTSRKKELVNFIYCTPLSQSCIVYDMHPYLTTAWNWWFAHGMSSWDAVAALWALQLETFGLW